MTQKTFSLEGYKANGFTVGDEVVLISYTQESGNCTNWEIIKHTGQGIPGNVNQSICRYHGWRGTSNGWATYAHGVRKITKIVEDPKDIDFVKITVGKDLHPEWE